MNNLVLIRGNLISGNVFSGNLVSGNVFSGNLVCVNVGGFKADHDKWWGSVVLCGALAVGTVAMHVQPHIELMPIPSARDVAQDGKPIIRSGEGQLYRHW
jgi:hypothetical protein